MTWSFIEHITESLRRKQVGDPKAPSHWPSEATAIVDGKVLGACRRKAFFRFLFDSWRYDPESYTQWDWLVKQVDNAKTPDDPYMLWIWAQGELYEHYLVKQSQRSGVFADDQVRIYIRSHNVSGSIDIEALNPRTGKRVIVESKSIYADNADYILGRPGSGKMGKPRDSNLMQIGLYHWWRASEDPAFENSRLVYGSRDTGRYGEFEIRTVDIDGVTFIEYAALAPHPGQWINSGITIDNVLENYALVADAVKSGIIPARDFSLRYSDEELHDEYINNQLSDTDREKYEQVMARREYNRWVDSIPGLSDEELLAEAKKFADELPKALRELLDAGLEGKKLTSYITKLRKLEAKREFKQIDKSDYQCRYCSYAGLCFDENGKPTNLGE